MDIHTAETAMMLWEEYTLILQSDDDAGATAAYRYQAANGITATRHAAIKLAPAINSLWDALSGDQYLMDGIAFDFEYIPALFEGNMIDENWQLQPYAYERMCAWRDVQNTLFAAMNA